MKKIALDLDGVIFDSENLYRVFAEMHDVDKFGCDNLIDNSPRIFQNRYNWSSHEFKTFYANNFKEVLTTANIMTGASLVLKKLMNFFELIIITARDDEETLIAKKRLLEVGLGNIKIFNNEHSKIERLIEEKCDYIIDDDEDIVINAGLKGIKAIYFKNAASINKSDVQNVKVVNNWGEIYKYLMLDNN